MSMPILEHENEGSVFDGLATRDEVTLISVSPDRSFLIKKMEIEFMVMPGEDADTETSAFTSFAPDVGLLVLYHDDGTSSDAEASLDATLQDTESHNDIIWSQPFQYQVRYIYLDDTSGTGAVIQGIPVVLKRTKSFPKGYPLDKDDTYSWRAVNVKETAAFSNPTGINTRHFLRVRYFGVYL